VPVDRRSSFPPRFLDLEWYSAHTPFRKTLEEVHILIRAERVRQNGRIVRCPIMLGMASHAVCYVPNEVLTPRQARRRASELPRRQRARPRPDERPPADGERDSRSQNQHEHGKHQTQRLSKSAPPRNLLPAEPAQDARQWLSEESKLRICSLWHSQTLNSSSLRWREKRWRSAG
jgi:hypothetical protein